MGQLTVTWIAAYHQVALGAGGLLAIVTVVLVIVGLCCEMGWLRLGSGRFLVTSLVFMAPIALSNLALTMPAPTWYPTPSPIWGAVPWLSFGLAALLRGWNKDR